MADSAPSLRSRAPASTVMEQTLVAQELARPRSGLARAFGARPLHPDAAHFYRGALGELEVARILGRLDDEWVVLHAVPLGSSDDIDHLVIGPPGIFVITTTHQRGRKVWAAGAFVMIDGRRTGYMGEAEVQGMNASRLLAAVTNRPITAVPVIVVVGAASVEVRAKPHVPVIAANSLVGWLTSRRAVFSPAEVAYLATVAERPAIWTARAPREIPELPAAFDQLRQEIALAWRLQRIWLLAAALLTATGLGVATWLIVQLVHGPV